MLKETANEVRKYNVVMVGVWRMCSNKAVGCTLRGANNGKITTADEACQSTPGAVILPSFSRRKSGPGPWSLLKAPGSTQSYYL